MGTPVEDLFAEVERVANDRVLDIIQTLIMRRPHCRRLVALREYVSFKLEVHRQKKRERYEIFLPRARNDTHPAESSWTLSLKAKAKRIDYYSTDCDCGDCKIKDRPSVFAPLTTNQPITTNR